MFSLVFFGGVDRFPTNKQDNQRGSAHQATLMLKCSQMWLSSHGCGVGLVFSEAFTLLAMACRKEQEDGTGNSCEGCSAPCRCARLQCVRLKADSSEWAPDIRDLSEVCVAAQGTTEEKAIFHLMCQARLSAIVNANPPDIHHFSLALHRTGREPIMCHSLSGCTCLVPRSIFTRAC